MCIWVRFKLSHFLDSNISVWDRTIPVIIHNSIGVKFSEGCWVLPISFPKGEPVCIFSSGDFPNGYCTNWSVISEEKLRVSLCTLAFGSEQIVHDDLPIGEMGG